MQRIYLNDNWYFARNYTEDLLNPETDLSELRKVRIPHSVCELSYSNFDEMSVQQLCGYRRSLIVEDAWRGGHLILTFEGAAHEAAVYVNGKLALKHYGGYTAFSVDILPFLAEGSEQIITVRLDSRESLNQPPFGSVTESLTYGGIYRDVYLDVKDEFYIEDIYTATPDVRTDEKILKAQIKLNAYTEGLRLAAHLDTWTEIPLEGEELQHWDLKTADVHFRTSCLTYTVPEADEAVETTVAEAMPEESESEKVDSKEVDSEETVTEVDDTQEPVTEKNQACCAKCGAPLEEDALFCTSCGARV